MSQIDQEHPFITKIINSTQYPSDPVLGTYNNSPEGFLYCH